jgi:hypothetical protein
MATRADWERFNREVRQALYTQMETADGLPPVDKRAHENVRFRPPTDGSPWVRITFDPGAREVAGLGPEALHRADGLYRIDCYTKAGDTPDEGMTMAGALEAVFTSATDLVSLNGQIVHIKRCYSRTAVESRHTGYLLTPVTVEWWADIHLFP